jgi:predicted enzyme related to lactoylglutathione lyase
MNSGQPCWIDITVTQAADRERLVDFLCDVFDWTFEVTGPDTGFYTMLRRDGVDVAAVGQQEHGAGRWVTYLSTDDIVGTAIRVRDAGGDLVREPMTVMRAGTMALASDPTDAVFGLWQPDLFAGFPDVVEAGCPEWFHHGSSDPEAAAQFYARVFALEQQAEGSDIMMRRDGRGYFSLGRNGDGRPADLRPVILVEDLTAVERRVRSAGGTIYAARVAIPGGFATTFADPVVGAPLIASVNAEGIT